jgi:hypothetical protein
MGGSLPAPEGISDPPRWARTGFHITPVVPRQPRNWPSHLDQVDGRERTERRGSQGSTDIEVAEINREIARSFNKLADLPLRIRIVAGIEEDSLAASRWRIWQDFGIEVVERLHESAARNKLAKDLARILAAKIDCPDPV